MINIKSIALTTGIAILTTLFLVFLVDAFYSSPEYNEFCDESFARMPIKLATEECQTVNNIELEQQRFREKGEVRYNYSEEGCPIESYCEYCVKEYYEASSNFNKNIFYILAILGIIAILVGLFLPDKLDPISSGLVFAGILVLAQGTIRVFGDLGKTPRVIVLGIELVLLVWIGYKRIIKKK